LRDLSRFWKIRNKFNDARVLCAGGERRGVAAKGAGLPPVAGQHEETVMSLPADKHKHFCDSGH